FSGETQIFAWNDKGSPIQSARQKSSFQVKSDRVSNAGIAFVPARPGGVNLSGGLLRLRYRSAVPMKAALITLKPLGSTPAVASLIPTEIFSHFAGTGDGEAEISFPLPATPGLARTKEVVITFGPESQGQPIDLSITGLTCTPIASAEQSRGPGPAVGVSVQQRRQRP